MRLTKYIVLFLAGFVASAAVAELVLRLLPVTKGLYRTLRHQDWPMHGYGPQQRFSYSTTWQLLHPQRGVTNNYGQVAPFDYVPGSHPVVVVGDSFIESQMNVPADTLQGELGRLFAGRVPVYGFGFGGNSLAEYLALARLTRTEFAPVAMVFLIIDNDVKESWTNRIGHRYFEIGADGVREGYLPLSGVTMAQRVRQMFGDSALYRYIQANLGFTVDRVLNKHVAPAPSSNTAIAASEEKSRRAVDYFLEQLPEAADLAPAQLVLVFDSDRGRIYDSTRPPRKGVDSQAVQTYFRERAKAAGFVVVDTGALFAEHFRRYQRRFDYQPVDSHWNGLGHRVVAAQVHRCLAAAGTDDGNCVQSGQGGDR